MCPMGNNHILRFTHDIDVGQLVKCFVLYLAKPFVDLRGKHGAAQITGTIHLHLGLSAGLAAIVSRLYGDSGENRSEEHTSELQSLMRISSAVFCLKKKKKTSTTYK